MCFKLDESLALVEFSVLLELRFEGGIIRVLLVNTSEGLLAITDECLINALLGLYCGNLILFFRGFLLTFSCFLKE
jgi:hypothetical protein